MLYLGVFGKVECKLYVLCLRNLYNRIMNTHHSLHMDLCLQDKLRKVFEQYGVLG